MSDSIILTSEKDKLAHLICEKLIGYTHQFSTQPRRFYGGEFDDWPDNNTGRHTHPVVYGLWNSTEEINPVYIGQSTNMGKRMSEHFSATYWSREIKYVSYLEHEDFNDPSILSTVEKFLFAVFKPTDNDPSS